MSAFDWNQGWRGTSASHAWAWSQKAAAKETKESPCLFRHKWDDSNLLLSLRVP